MPSSMKIEFYPLWMQENPDLFEKSKARFLAEALGANLNKIEEYWKFGLFYIEASA